MGVGIAGADHDKQLVYNCNVSRQTGSHICRAGASCSHSRGVPKTLSGGSRTHPRGVSPEAKVRPTGINSGASYSHSRGGPLKRYLEAQKRILEGVSPDAVLSPPPLNPANPT
jgi:hypothetical protein